MRHVVLLSAVLAFAAVRAHAGEFDLHGVDGLDEYLDEHPGIERALEKNPSLANDEGFKKTHPGLVKFLHSHPLARTELEDAPDTSTMPDIEEPKKPTTDAQHRLHHMPIGSSLVHHPTAENDDDD